MSDINEKFILVTGSTKGIGRSIAETFVEQKARVIVHGRKREAVESACSALGAFGCVDGDLGTAEGCHQVIDQLAQLGKVDVLINNVGIFSVDDFFDVDDEEWLRYFQINIMSAVRLCRALMPSMLENNWGRIINVSSEAGIKPLPQMIHYSMTKTSLISLSRGLAELTKGTNVTVNSVLPGPTWTEGVESYFEGLSAEEQRPVQEVIESYFSEHEPTSLIQRFVDAKEVADAILFLAQNGAVNGSAQRVEGGIIRSI
ncbi:SDR family NAD(P)-dependent oxidoreductase [Pseudomonadota bacterium]